MTLTPVTMAPPDAVQLRHQKLEKAARQFEGMFMNELLKPLRDQDGEESAFGDTMKSYGTEALATAMASRGELGFGARMIASVEDHEKSAVTGSSTGR